jgi:hypothetical protein
MARLRQYLPYTPMGVQDRKPRIADYPREVTMPRFDPPTTAGVIAMCNLQDTP